MPDFSSHEDDDEDYLPLTRFPSEAPLPADRWEFVHVVHALVPAAAVPPALTGAIEAFHRLHVRSEHVDAYQLVQEFVEVPERYLARRWGRLPGVVRLDSGIGRRLLSLALERSQGQTDNTSRYTPELGSRTPYLCTDTGTGLWTQPEVVQYRRSVDDPLWIVPAVTFRRRASRSYSSR